MNPSVTIGDVTIGQILSGKLKRDIMPNSGYYTSLHALEDKYRFDAFLTTPAAKTLHGFFDEWFDPDGLFNFAGN